MTKQTNKLITEDSDAIKRDSDIHIENRPSSSFSPRRVSQSFDGVESLTVKSDMPMTSIRELLRRGSVPENPNEMTYGDFTDVVDYETVLQRVITAQESFDSLPAKVRDRFKNDPANLIEFLNDESNRDEAIKLGLINPPEKPAGPSKGESPQAPEPLKKKASEPLKKEPSDDSK